jgi:hypothetical protein
MSRRAHALGRRKPKDFTHVSKYPLSEISVMPKAVPVVLGINWYENFDSPVKVGSKYVIGRGDLGNIRGGHAICARPVGVTDLTSWWDFYDQGQEGACVGFSCSRMMTLLNRKRYVAPWLYGEAQKIDEWPGEDYDGTSVRAACDVLRSVGHVATTRQLPTLADGILANRWATTWDQVRAALGVPDSQLGIQLMNSWGRSYPHYVTLTDEAGERLLSEDGEACLVTDR